MKWYVVLANSFAALIVHDLILIGLFFIWWNTPLAPHMDLETAMRALPSDYTNYWRYFWWLAGVGVVYLTAIVILMVAILKRIK